LSASFEKIALSRARVGIAEQVDHVEGFFDRVLGIAVDGLNQRQRENLHVAAERFLLLGRKLEIVHRGRLDVQFAELYPQTIDIIGLEPAESLQDFHIRVLAVFGPSEHVVTLFLTEVVEQDLPGTGFLIAKHLQRRNQRRIFDQDTPSQRCRLYRHDAQRHPVEGIVVRYLLLGKRSVFHFDNQR
jgi:hypothetical protein